MARARVFEVSGINIRVHSKHDPSEYKELWKQLHRQKLFVTYAKNVLMIGDVRIEDIEASTDQISGHFYRYLDVNPDNPWFNIVRHKKASDADVELVKIPPELKPDLVEIPYVFDIKNHRLYFVSHEKDANLSVRFVHKLLVRLTETEAIINRFGNVDLTILTETSRVEALLRWPVIRTLTIKIDRPNPNEEDDEAEFYDRLRRRGLGSETRIYKKADDADSVIPDKEMEQLALIAADNGLVEVSGKNPELWPDKATSQDFPLTLKGSYDSKLQTLMDALRSIVGVGKPAKNG